MILQRLQLAVFSATCTADLLTVHLTVALSVFALPSCERGELSCLNVELSHHEALCSYSRKCLRDGPLHMGQLEKCGPGAWLFLRSSSLYEHQPPWALLVELNYDTGAFVNIYHIKESLWNFIDYCIANFLIPEQKFLYIVLAERITSSWRIFYSGTTLTTSDAQSLSPPFTLPFKLSTSSTCWKGPKPKWCKIVPGSFLNRFWTTQRFDDSTWIHELKFIFSPGN